jgi:uncharacterized protein (TIGR03437 family)
MDSRSFAGCIVTGLLLLGSPASAQVHSSRDPIPAAASCTPTRLIVTYSTVALNFFVPPGYPQLIGVIVTDDCGSLRTDATVVVFFSNGDPPLNLIQTPPGSGLYLGASNPINKSVSSIRLVVTAFAHQLLGAPGINPTIVGQIQGTAAFTLTTQGLILSQTGFTFQSAGGVAPAPERFVINANGPAATFTITATTTSGGPWLNVAPPAGVADPSQGASVAVSVNPAGLAPGDYYGLIRIDSTAPNAPLFATVVLRVAPAVSAPTVTAGIPARIFPAPPRSACTPTRLNPSIAFQTSQFHPVASFPAPLIVNVLDDCQQPMPATGVVGVSFDNGDLPLTLSPQDAGNWTGTWTPQSTSSNSVMFTAQANYANLQGLLQGTANLATGLDLSGTAPVLSPAGAVSAASYSSPALASGEMVAIFGANLAGGLLSANSLPLGIQLGDTLLSLSGHPLPLLFVSEGQVNAVLPYGLTPNTGYQLIATRGTKTSSLIPITLLATDPAVFSADSSGAGQGAIYRVAPGPVVRADASNPAKAGDSLLLYCTGLGALDSAVVDGSAAPLDRLVHATETVTATISGVSAPVAFAGLAPGLAVGLYQVNLTVPSGIAPGNQVPVLISAGGNTAPPVLISVQ